MKLRASATAGIIALLIACWIHAAPTHAQDDVPRRLLPPVVVEPDESPTEFPESELFPGDEGNLFG